MHFYFITAYKDFHVWKCPHPETIQSFLHVNMCGLWIACELFVLDTVLITCNSYFSPCNA